MREVGSCSRELQAADSEPRYFTKGTMRIVRFMCDEHMGWKNWMVCKHLLVPSRALIAHGAISQFTEEGRPLVNLSRLERCHPRLCQHDARNSSEYQGFVVRSHTVALLRTVHICSLNCNPGHLCSFLHSK